MKPHVPERRSRRSRVKRFWQALGPGVITGAADDDPSGIATYSIAGAQLGNGLLWTAWITWPLMAAVQMMCARIGMVSGSGVMAALQQKFPRPVLLIAATALLVANTFNIGADLAGMADAADLLTGIRSHVWVVVFAVGIGWATVGMRYGTLANILKWLALVLFVYVIAALHVGPSITTVARGTLLPTVPGGRDGWRTLVAILGTTISPYLFFWQASQEVEEEKAKGRATVASRWNATPSELRRRKIDVGVGTLFSNLVMFFIILTTALTLHRHHIMHPRSSRDVAQALQPLAGRFSALLYTLGLVGTGLLAIPTLSGSAAYAFAEAFGWEQGIDARFTQARAFYGVVVLSMVIGALMDFFNINPVLSLYWSAVLNGLLAPFLLVGILLVASDRAIMKGQPSSRLGITMVAVTTALMFAAGVAMFVL